MQLTAAQIHLLKQALDATEASMKRAINTKRDARFTTLYEKDILTINEIRAAIAEDVPGEKKK